MDAISQISLFAAFSAGLLSFISPCVLPLVPSYLSYITGLSVENLAKVEERERFKSAILLNALLFIAGFSTVFIAFGASASLIGQVLYEYQDVIRKIGGILIIIFGLYLLGMLKLNIFMTERRLVHFESRPVGYLGSYLIGTAFAAHF
jgi:cytochrome c-type biogenesis protein